LAGGAILVAAPLRRLHAASSAKGISLTAAGARVALAGEPHGDTDMWTYNGAINGVAAEGHSMEPILTLTRGRSYILALNNETAWYHPIHLHGHAFRVITRNGQPTPYREWCDTVLVPPRERAEIAFVADNPGDWMQCSCCEGYADYLRKSGFEVSIVNTHDLPLMNEQYGVPEELQGCHLSTVAGYFVGGHVPVDVLRRMLSERPSIKGITLTGMPEGSPGMYGRKTAPFKIYAISEGPPKLYASV
jgi:hypothetical protein